MATHWLLAKELKWRTYTSIIWTWMTNFVILHIFLFFWILSPWSHVHVLHDFFAHLVSMWTFFLLVLLASFSVLYIPTFSNLFSVISKIPVSRYEMLKRLLQTNSMLLMVCHGALNVVIYVFVSLLTTSTSSPFGACSSQTSGDVCLNEYWFLLVMFSFCVGAANFLCNEKEKKYSLYFSSIQQTRILYLKCNILSVIMSSMITSLKFTRNFVVFYYFFGFIPRDFVATLIGLKTNVLNILGIIPVFWTMLLLGSLLLVLHNMTWNMFNLCVTKRFDFLVDSVFPEDAEKLLTANLNEKQPTYVQHLAFQCLTHLTCNSPTVRKQVFALQQGGVTSKTSKWNVIADECLLRITNFTAELTNHSLRYAGHFDNDQKNVSRLSSKSSTSSQSSTSDEKSPFLSVSNLRRRPLNSDGASSPNMSYFNVSTLDTTAANLANSPYRTGTNLVIPTPKLWTRQLYKNSLSNPAEGSYAGACDDQGDQKPLNTQMNNFMTTLEKSLKKFSLVSYLVKKMPDRVAANLFSGGSICKWALQSISILAEASFVEDVYGIVQRRLHEIIAALLDLHNALEKYNKLPVTSSSSSVACMLLEIRSLRSECKSAIYRITDTFGSHLDVIPITADHRRKLRTFTEHKE